MICPFCKSHTADNSNFCSECGKRIPRDTAVTDRLQAPASGETGQFSGNADEGFRQAEAGQPTSGCGRSPNTNTDPKLVKALKGINTMNVLQIICLVLLFIPIANILGGILLLIILIVSLGLAGKVSAVFNQYGYPLYARMTDRIGKFCLFFLACLLIVPVLNILAPDINELRQNMSPEVLDGVLSALGITGIIILSTQIYSFCRLYTVKDALENICSGYPLPPIPGSSGLITVIILVIDLMTIIIYTVTQAISSGWPWIGILFILMSIA